MTLRAQQQFSPLVVALAAAFTGCQTGAQPVRTVNYRQPVAAVRQPSAESNDPWVQDPVPDTAEIINPSSDIRPGHSLDVGIDRVDPTSKSPLHDQHLAPSPALSEQTRDELKQLVPPPPVPPPYAPGGVPHHESEQSAPVPPLDPAEQLEGVAPPVERDVTGREVTSPDLATPFSIRGLYQKLRGREHQSDVSPEQRILTTSQRHLSPETLAPGSSRDYLHPVALGRPETQSGQKDSMPTGGDSTVKQACPSCFQWPMRAE